MFSSSPKTIPPFGRIFCALFFFWIFSSVGCSAQWTQDLIRKLTISPTDTVSLVFFGDIMQHGMQIKDAEDRGFNYRPCFAAMIPAMQAADLTIANIETTFAGRPYTGYPVFSAPDPLLPQLKEFGVGVLLTANNHIGDKGVLGLKRSLHLLDSTGVSHTGLFRSAEERQQRYPLMVERKGIRIAFLNCTYGTNGFTIPLPYLVNRLDTVQMAQDIRKAQRQGADFIVACMHWGDEEKLQYNDRQKALAEFLFRHGVDMVIGAHPHVPQDMELRYHPNGEIKQVLAYSLGNMVSNQPFPNTQIGLKLEIKLIKSGFYKRIYSFTHEWIVTEWQVEGGLRRHYILPLEQAGKVSESVRISPEGRPRGTVDFVINELPGKRVYSIQKQK